MFPIEEQDDELEEEEGPDIARGLTKMKGGSAVATDDDAMTPIKAFAQLVQSENDELRLTSNRPKSPTKSLSNFNISSSLKGSGKRSERDISSRIDEQGPIAQIGDVERSSPIPSDSRSEAILLRSYRVAKGLDSSYQGSKQGGGQ